MSALSRTRLITPTRALVGLLVLVNGTLAAVLLVSSRQTARLFASIEVSRVAARLEFL